MKNTFDDQLAKDGRYADVTEELYQAFRRRLAAETARVTLSAPQQVRLAITLELMDDPAIMALEPAQVERCISLMELLVRDGERFRTAGDLNAAPDPQ